MKGLGKITGARFLGAAALAVAGSLSLSGCSEDSSSWWSPVPREVEATLPSLAVAEAITVEPMGSRAQAAGASVASSDNDGLFTVGLGPDEGMGGTAAATSPATRAEAALSDVWVLQFDAAGATKACAYVGTVAAGAKVKAALLSGEGYTVWIVANGPAAGGFTTSNPATLSDFESKLLHTAVPASDELIPLSGKLSSVRVLDNGQVFVGSDNTVVPQVALIRAMARVDVVLEYDVSGAEFDGVWLYQVPAGACYGLASAATDFPASGEASDFGYRNGDSGGLAPKSSGSGTVTHTWYIGDNRRGQVPSIRWEKNKGKDNAPAMATYARIKSHESADATRGLYHDVYLGENVTTDFDVKRNRHYIYRVRIGGSLDDQKLLAGRDDRVWAGTLEYLDGNGIPTVTPSLDQKISENGQTFKVTFSGYWAGEGIPVRATAGGTKLAEGSAVCTGNTGEATLDVPKNEGTERRILFEYRWKGEWIPIGTGTQAGYSVTGKTHDAPETIPQAGGTYHVTLTGVLPAAGVEVRAQSGGTALVTGKVTASGTPATLDLPANTAGAERTVKFEYLWNGTWTQIGDECSQEGLSVGSLYGGGVVYWVNPGDATDFRVVALVQESSMSQWAGGDIIWMYDSDVQDKTARNGADIWKIAQKWTTENSFITDGDFSWAFPAFNSCYEYTGPDGKDPKGTWYLPSYQELQDLYDAKGSVESAITTYGGTPFSADCYWSATEDSGSAIWIITFADGSTQGYTTTANCYVRCIRGK